MLSPVLGLIGLTGLVAIHLLRCLSSPLNRIPGPALAKYTSWILKWHEFHANRTRYIHDLHLQYGPTVRIAPTEVAFASKALSMSSFTRDVGVVNAWVDPSR